VEMRYRRILVVRSAQPIYLVDELYAYCERPTDTVIAPSRVRNRIWKLRILTSATS
jgi:hypothetical protein